MIIAAECSGVSLILFEIGVWFYLMVFVAEDKGPLCRLEYTLLELGNYGPSCPYENTISLLSYPTGNAKFYISNRWYLKGGDLKGFVISLA